MVETDANTYNLSSKERNQSLKISLINEQQINMIIVNLDTEQQYTALVTLPQIKEMCQYFQSVQTPKEALSILKTCIESGGIILMEDLEENNIELKYSIKTEKGELIPFDIILNLDKESENQNQNNDEEKDVQILQPIFDFKGNQEVETKYGNVTNDTTEFIKPIVQSNYKPPVLELEIIEPIVQVHYPDGTTKSTALPPRIQGPGGENITEEQLKSIQEQMNSNSTIKNFSPLKDFLNSRSNSVAKKHSSIYSTQSTPHPNNNIAIINPFGNVVRPANEDTQNQMYNHMNSSGNGINHYNMNHSFNNSVNDFHRTTSGYSTMTIQNRPFIVTNPNYTAQVPNPTIQNNNLNHKNLFKSQKHNHYNRIIERRPRMINGKGSNLKDEVRSLSSPHENDINFNSSQNSNIYQPNPTSNPFQTNQNHIKADSKAEKFPYDRNTQKPTLRKNNINNIPNLAKNKAPKNKKKKKKNNNSIQKVRNSQPHNNLTQIKLQQQRLKEVQEKLVFIQKQQQQLQEKQKELFLQQQQSKIIKNKIKVIQDLNGADLDKNSQQLIKQNKSTQNQEENRQLPKTKKPIKHTNSLTDNPKYQNKELQQINKNKKNNLGYQTKTSTPMPTQTPTLGNGDFNQQLLTLAQIASMQNEANPQFKNLKAITLEQQDQQVENTEEQEVQEYLPQEEQEREYEDVANENEAYAALQQDNSQANINIESEALFFTEEGRVIFRNGLLRGIIHRYVEIDEVVGKIQDILSKGVKFTLVYKAFDVGDSARTFHEKCDKLKMSLVLIETDKDVRFGGFTTNSWDGHCLKKIDNNAFVFSLDNNTIYDIIENKPAIGCYPKFGPVFFGCQIRIYDEFFTKGGTTCRRGMNYKTSRDYELNNGEQKYLIKDIEIYDIETVDIE